MLELFTSVADALISYAIDKLDPAERIKSWLRLDPARLAFKKALARAYSAFARQYPEYTSSLFDQSFLSTDALPELSKLLTRDLHPDPALLAQAWGRSLGAPADFAQAATKPAAYFLERFEAELKAEPALQSIFDSRAVESLPKLEAEIQKLSADLQRGLDEALKAASDYQKVTLHIGGDVKDSNIIIGDNNVINNYYYSGDFIALNEYYIPPDGVFQRVRVDEFIGRDWLTAKVDAFLNDPNRKSGAFLLIGDAGVGKTSFMAHLVKERRYLHLFAEQAPGQAMLQRAMQSLGSQLVTRYQIDPYKDRDTLNALSVFPDFLERILRLAASTLTEDEKIVIVCDALDEAGTFPDHFVFGLPKELPDGVYFILSQRPVNVKLPNFEPVIEKLEAQGEGNMQDMQTYLSAVAKRPEVAGQIRSKEYSEEYFIQTLKEKSQGVWMYLRYIIKEIESGARAPLDVANLPTGVVGYYAEYWDTWRTGKRGKGEEAWDELYVPLLTTLAAAQEAIPVDWLIQWANVNAKPREVTRLLTEHWRAFIIEKEVNGQKAYTPYHLSLKDFITGKVDTDKLPPDQANLVKDLATQTVDAHKHILRAFEKECNGEWEKLVEQNYPRMYLTAHLNGAGEYKKLIDLLTEGDEKIKWAQAREQKEETFAGYLNDLTYVWDYAEQVQSHALAIRCMFIENSINSLISNISPKLLAELAKSKIWTYSKCLSIFQQYENDSDKIIFLRLVGEYLPPSLLSEISLIIDKMNEQEQDNARAIICRFSDKPFDLLSRIKDDRSYSYALVGIAEQKRKIDFDNLLLLANKISKNHAVHADTLIWLSKHFPVGKKNEILNVAFMSAKKVYEAEKRFYIIRNIIRESSDEIQDFYLQEAMKCAEMLDEKKQLDAYIEMMPYQTIEFKLDVLNRINKIVPSGWGGKGNRGWKLAKASQCFPEGQKKQIVSEAIKTVTKGEHYLTSGEADSLSGLSHLISFLPPEYKMASVQDALNIAKSIKDIHYEEGFASNLVYLLEATPDDNREYVAREILNFVSNKITSHKDYIKLVSEAISYLPDKEKKERLDLVIKLTAKIRDEDGKSYFLSPLAEFSSLEDFYENLSDIQKIKDDHKRVWALANITPYLTKSNIPTILQTVMHLKYENYYISCLSETLQKFPKEIKEDIAEEFLLLIEKTKNENVKQKLLICVADIATEKSKNYFFAILDRLRSNKLFFEIIGTVAKYTPSLLEGQPINFNRKITGDPQTINSVIILLPHLNETLKTKISEEVFSKLIIEEPISLDLPEMIDQMIFFGKQFENEQWGLGYDFDKYRNVSETIEKNIYKVKTAIAIIDYLTESSKSSVIESAQAFLSKGYKLAEYKIFAYLELLADLIPHLKEKNKQFYLSIIIESVQDINNFLHDKNLFRKIYLLLDDETQKILLQRSLSHLLAVQDYHARVKKLDMLIPVLPNDLLPAALECVQTIHDFGEPLSYRFYANILIAPRLSGDEKSTVENEILRDSYKKGRYSEFPEAENLISGALYFGNNIAIYQDALFVSEDFEMLKLLAAWRKINFEGLESALLQYFKHVAKKKRENAFYLMASLIPVLSELRDENFTSELYRTITDVTRWWP